MPFHTSINHCNMQRIIVVTSMFIYIVAITTHLGSILKIRCVQHSFRLTILLPSFASSQGKKELVRRKREAENLHLLRIVCSRRRWWCHDNASLSPSYRSFKCNSNDCVHISDTSLSCPLTIVFLLCFFSLSAHPQRLLALVAQSLNKWITLTTIIEPLALWI
jgi:hypothetical protein